MRIETERLILRPWEDRDIDAYAAVIGDPHVRRFFPETGTREDAERGIANARRKLVENGFHLGAAELRTTGEFVGMIGIARIRDAIREALRGKPPVEIGWQFAQRFWGQGLAPEGARALLAHAWTLGLDEVVAFTAVGNLPSRRVMEKIGMQYDPEGDFLHPEVPDGNKLKAHVLYRVGRPG